MDIHVILPAALRVRSGGAQGTRDVHIANHSSWETPDLALAVRDILARCDPSFLSDSANRPLTLVFTDQRRARVTRLAVPHARYGGPVQFVRITLCHPHECLESPIQRLVVAQSPRVLAPAAFHRDLAIAVVQAAGGCNRGVRADVPVHGGAVPANGQAPGLLPLLREQRRAERGQSRASQLRVFAQVVDVSDEDFPRNGETRAALAHVEAVVRLLDHDTVRITGEIARSFRVTEATRRL